MEVEYKLMFCVYPAAFVVYLIARLFLPDFVAVWVGFASFVGGLSALYVALRDSLEGSSPPQDSKESRSQEME